ncbi:MAG: hypothetical protein J3K34DRAFT_415960 [Monoraphidium minutum]|nr:MAG: hypothetical protein J3K34DRAFT_415960 [Monoraphidium minutum]
MNSRNGSSGATAPKRSFKDYCRLAGSCIRVSPWVPLIGSIMITVGLPVWAIYTRRALDTSRFLSDTLFEGRTFAMDQLITSVTSVTGLAVIVISAVVGLCLLLSLARSFQETARLPTTKCSSPGKLSYGAYATLLSVITFGLWLMSAVVALLIAAQLCWMLLAFMFQTAFTQGVAQAPGGATTTPLEMYESARTALNGLAADPAAVAKGSPLAESAAAFAAAANEVPIIICPATCFNLGSFYSVFGAAKSCACAAAAQYPELAAAATDTWKHLTHALAALALMGLADLWLIMNLSAQFAHARRDLRDVSGSTAASQGRISDDAGAVFVTTNPTYSPKKASSGVRRDTAARDNDTRGKLGAGAAYALPDSVLNPAPAGASLPLRDDFLPIATTDLAADGPGIEAAAASPSAGGGPDGGQDGDASRQYNTTAQRYAAYRLRAAQASGKSPGKDRQWNR